MGATFARLAAAAVIAAAAGTGALAPAPAQAAACGSGHGVTVVVDPHQLGGAVQAACDPAGAGKAAASLFTDNGFALTYAQRQPGFVCRINGAPSGDPCVNTSPADAYWGLFWSDGTSGTWSYASEGAGSLSVPDGGYIAFSWQGSTSKAPPGMSPKVHASASPSPSHSATPTRRPSPSGSAGTETSATPTTASSASASASPSARASKKARQRPAASAAATVPATPSSTPTVGEEPAAQAGATESGEGLPGWVVPGVLAGLVAAAGGAAFVRRTRGAPPP
jgi:hypothetical protein